ncbi:MAG: [FeFe] hydrogenase H-cluster radical SAM maturase HydE, partial [Spirochaetota bacterium]|nr:[FeFe] hydrogenase H-cluster radical SAM maturase HydE [Spirochaetota bacterium]
LHPGMSFENRLRCLNSLFELGYQNGSGIITGLPGQTPESIARDILWLYELDFDMISIGPFVPHPGTPLGKSPHGTAELSFRAIALTRILTRNAHMPATTALAAGQVDLRPGGLLAGANVIMPNFTPPRYAVHYDIYPKASRGSVGTGTAACSQTDSACSAIEAAGRIPDFSRGDSLKSRIALKEGAST